MSEYFSGSKWTSIALIVLVQNDYIIVFDLKCERFENKNIYCLMRKLTYHTLRTLQSSKRKRKDHASVSHALTALVYKQIYITIRRMSVMCNELNKSAIK